MRPETVICWKWAPAPGYRSTFGPETVNVLAAMVRRHYRHQHRFVCVTDQPDGIDSSVEILPAWNDYAAVPSPHGRNNPSCYRRLRLFHPDAAQWFGERFVSLDLDVVITDDLDPLWNRDEDVVFWGDTNPLPGSHYNGSMQLIRAGSRPQVWTEFDQFTSPQASYKAKSFGSDQGHISRILGPGEAKWTQADGVYSYRNHIAPDNHRLPANARVVVFHGHRDPWDSYVQMHCPWVRQHWTTDEAVPA